VITMIVVMVMVVIAVVHIRSVPASSRNRRTAERLLRQVGR
jgi:hypothetical protein